MLLPMERFFSSLNNGPVKHHISGVATFCKIACLLLILFPIFIVPPLSFAQEEGKIFIQFENSQLSVDIQGAKLLDVIEKLKEVAGVDIQFDSQAEKLVNLKFEGLSLQEGVEQFFPNSTVILENEDSTESVDTVDVIENSFVWSTTVEIEASVEVPSETSSVTDSSETSSVTDSSEASSAPVSTSPSVLVIVPQSVTSSTPVSEPSKSVTTFSAGDLAAFGSLFSQAKSMLTPLTYFAFTFPAGNSKTAARLSVAEIDTIIAQAVDSLNNSVNMVVAVVDRQGRILGVKHKSGGTTVANQDTAVALARTAAFFSHNQAVLTSRTVRFISGEHFPPSISFTPNGALFGIENNNRGCFLNVTFIGGQSFPQSLGRAGGLCTNASQVGCGSGTMTIPGSFPLYKGTILVGGIGVFGIGPALANDPQGGLRKSGTGYEAEEFAALQGAVGFEPPQFSGGGIFIDGIRLPGVVQTTRPAGFSADPGAATVVDVASNDPGDDKGSIAVPSGFLVGPTAGGSFTVADLNTIINQSRDFAKQTRAAIRLPFTETARMVFAIGDLNGNILAVYRQSDATVFSLDVAIAKARNVAYFSGSAVAAQDEVGLPSGTAITNRTISFGSQRFFPSGIDFAGSGPYRNVFLTDSSNPCSQGGQATSANHNGIVFFPGSVPLYKNGVLIGGLGVSGDGVEQDDFVAAGGAEGFEPPSSIRADQNRIDGVRMPYFKFPRNPTNLGK